MAAISSECSICQGVESGPLGQVVGPNHKKELSHWFHKDCFNNWVNASPPPSCPLCRERITQIIVDGLEIPITAPVTIDEHPLVLAAIGNNLGEVETVLQQGDIPQEAFSLALRSAVQQGFQGVALAIISHRSDLHLHGIAVTAAASVGNQAFVDLLLTREAISEDEREEALRVAVNEDFVSVVNILLDNGSISDQGFENLIDSAVLNNNTRILRTLFSRPQMSVAMQSAGILLAAREGHLQPLRILLSYGALSPVDREEITPESRGLAVVEAAQNGHEDLVQALLANGSIPRPHLNLAFANAIGKGFLSIALALLVKGFSQILLTKKNILPLFAMMVLLFTLCYQLLSQH